MDCAGVCSSSTPANQGSTFGATAGTFGALYQNYYEDSDGDTFGKNNKGLNCSSSSVVTTGTNGNAWVTNQTDIDDNCKCSTNSDVYDVGSNPIPCHDDCGVCSYDAAGSALATRNDFRLCVDGSGADGCNDATNVGADGVWSDCLGTCSGTTPYLEQFANVDGDDFGGKRVRQITSKTCSLVRFIQKDGW